ncbi:2-C-methyl-D-erythritol 4-phosphate cytidylyltransferase [Chryseolinea sp. T2]|uniref:2-C-methyl-D-erythritol 4-phosphate cytidylyltransferase n=1 Tax=Chryseolinea sp. T2 TaxID=3129255 RepID=UPI003076B545
MHSKEVAIIVAGGKGLRLPGDIPKQFIEICGLPVLMHTVIAFRSYSASLEIILVLPAGDIPLWNELCLKHSFTEKITVVSGGSSRFHSVSNGLNQTSGPGLVAVHDGVRPLVTADIIASSFSIAKKCRSAVASVLLKESIREVESPLSAKEPATLQEMRSVSLDRTKFRLMQTPQTFDIALLKGAYDKALGDSFTDDASVVESTGDTITLFDGSYENIKITTPEDLIVAEAIMRSRKQK